MDCMKIWTVLYFRYYKKSFRTVSRESLGSVPMRKDMLGELCIACIDEESNDDGLCSFQGVCHPRWSSSEDCCNFTVFEHDQVSGAAESHHSSGPLDTSPGTTKICSPVRCWLEPTLLKRCPLGQAAAGCFEPTASIGPHHFQHCNMAQNKMQWPSVASSLEISTKLRIPQIHWKCTRASFAWINWAETLGWIICWSVAQRRYGIDMFWAHVSTNNIQWIQWPHNQLCTLILYDSSTDFFSVRLCTSTNVYDMSPTLSLKKNLAWKLAKTWIPSVTGMGGHQL